MLDYATLRIIWWLLLGILLIAFAIMDGFDLGAVALLPWVAKDDIEKRIVLNSIGATWEGNQVWIILGAGAIFAAWPYLYAASFSGFYLAMFIVLAAFILRPVSFKYRSKMPGESWRATWDFLLMLSGLVPCLIFGVAVGNVILGVPFHFDEMLRFYYSGSFGRLLNPFALLCGLLSIAMLSAQGAIYLCNKTQEQLQNRCRKSAMYCIGFAFILFAVGGFWLQYIPGYVLTKAIVTNGPSNPLHKVMIIMPHAWFNNYYYLPLLISIPMLGFISAFITWLVVYYKKYKIAMISNSFFLGAIIATVGISMFPVLLPSTENPSQSLLVWDASSSQLTLWLMLLVSIIFLPIVIVYTSWVYRVMKGPVTKKLFSNKQEKNLY